MQGVIRWTISFYKTLLLLILAVWVWQGAKNKAGYGTMTVEKKTVFAHRYSYQYHIGEIPEKLFVCHRCDNPSCINPDHLFLGDNYINILDASIKNRLATKEKNGAYTHKEKVRKGSMIGTAKLTEKQVLEIRSLYKIIPQKQLAQNYGVSRGTIQNIHEGRNWKHV